MHTSTTSFVRGDRAGPCSRARARGFVGQAGRKDLVIDAYTRSFVEDLDAEDLGGAHGAVLVGAREGHVERQHLVGIPGDGAFVEAIEGGDLGIELVDGGAYGQAGIAHDGAGEQGIGIRCVLGLVLGPDLVDIGYEVAAGLMKQVQPGVAVEVDPDEGACFGWSGKAGRLGVVVTFRAVLA